MQPKWFAPITRFFEKKQILLVALFFVGVAVIFNLPFLKEILRNPAYATLGEDTMLTHYFAERSYQELLKGKNWFEFNTNLLHPFGTATVFGETGSIHAFYFLFLRPFLHPYAALLATVVINLFLCQVIMFALLRKLKVSTWVSAIFAVAYAYAPFVSVRVQYHYNYVYHFIFALLVLLIIQLLQTKSVRNKILYAVALGAAASLLFYNTLYYVFMFILFVGFFIVYYLIVHRKEHKKNFDIFKTNIAPFIVSIVAALIFMSPFLMQFISTVKVTEPKSTQGWGGAIDFSANALDIITPSEFNPFYGAKINEKLKQYIPEKQPVEQIIYPGLIVLAGLLLFLKAKKQNLWHPLFLTGFSFYILSLGPFLHVFKFWNVRITETILGVIPLPYILLHKLPLLSMMRAPVRFAPLISFAFVILAAFAIDQFLKTNSKRKTTILVGLALLFFVDQYFIPTKQPVDLPMPLKSYEVIKQDPEDVAVLEIPYVIQDGFFYWGNVFNAHNMMGQLEHGKPILGGYLARVHQGNFDYYINDPVLGYYGLIGDVDRQKQKVPNKKPSYEEMANSIDFLGIRYIVVKEDLPAYQSIKTDLETLGFTRQLKQDNGYSLFVYSSVRDPEYIEVKGDILQSKLHLYGGWSHPEKDQRWIDGNTAAIVIRKTSESPAKFTFEASAYAKPRTMDMYVNKVYLQTMEIPVTPTKFSFTTGQLQQGLNRIEFKIHNEKMPKKLPGEDPRNLTVTFRSLVLE